MAGSFVIDTPEGMELFHLLQIRGCLRIEVNTGMKHSRGSILALCNKQVFPKLGIERCGTKKKALRLLGEYIETTYST